MNRDAADERQHRLNACGKLGTDDRQPVVWRDLEARQPARRYSRLQELSPIDDVTRSRT